MADGPSGRPPRTGEELEPEPLPAWAETLVRWLDDGARVPGTPLRFGLDPIIGALVPGGGDAATGAASVALLLLAVRRRLPTAAIFRMVLNIGLDVLVGSLPIAGDVFDAFYHSNRRNLIILQEHAKPGAKASPLDYLLLGLGVLLAIAGVVVPLVLLYLLGSSLLDWIRAGSGL